MPEPVTDHAQTIRNSLARTHTKAHRDALDALDALVAERDEWKRSFFKQGTFRLQLEAAESDLARYRTALEQITALAPHTSSAGYDDPVQLIARAALAGADDQEQTT